jgi:hypothetical protein
LEERIKVHQGVVPENTPRRISPAGNLAGIAGRDLLIETEYHESLFIYELPDHLIFVADNQTQPFNQQSKE